MTRETFLRAAGMKTVIWTIAFVLTSAAAAVFLVIGVYDWFAGPEKTKALLKKLHIPLCYYQWVLLSVVCVLAASLLYLFRDQILG